MPSKQEPRLNAARSFNYYYYYYFSAVKRNVQPKP